METIQWHYFRVDTPGEDVAILVEDHEGNQAVGGWVDDHFINVFGFPMGHLKKWSPINLFIHSMNHYECAAYYHNGLPIHLPSLYDDKPLFEFRNPIDRSQEAHQEPT